MPPLGCIRKEGGRWKIEEWFEHILKDKDQQARTRASGHPTSLVTTIRSSSEEKEWAAPGRSTRRRDSLDRKERGSPGKRRTKRRSDIPVSPRRAPGQFQPEAKAGSRSMRGRRGHWTFHTASAGHGKATEKEKDHPKPLSAPWRVNASRIQMIEEAIRNFGDPGEGATSNTEEPDQDIPENIVKHRVVEACMEVCWACADYGQTVIHPSFIGCCSRPKHPPHAEHICSECIDEINKQIGGEDQTEVQNYEPSRSPGVPEEDSGR